MDAPIHLAKDMGLVTSDIEHPIPHPAAPSHPGTTDASYALGLEQRHR